MSAYGLAGFDQWLQSPYEYENETSEAKESAIRERIESSDFETGEAISDYYDESRVEIEGHDLLTEFTIALAKFEPVMKKWNDGVPLSDDDNIAFRAIGRQVKEAVYRSDQAVTDAVEGRVG